MDRESEKKLAKVHPLLAERVRKLVGLTALDLRVVQGLRTYAEQDALYNQRKDGRDNDRDGRIDEADERVTNARGGFSNHNFGLAVDLCPFVNDKPDWDDVSKFKEIGKYLHEMGGLEWGGDWKFVDRPHVQLPGLTISLCRELYEKGGLPLVWQKVSELNGQVTAQPVAVNGSAVERDLKFGDKGADVRALQVKLNAALSLKMDIDGDFGKKTKTAVMEFQKQNGLDIDGIVGQNTRQKLGI